MNSAKYQHPAIYIVLQGVASQFLAPLFHGMEEEGIPFECIDIQADTVVHVAYQAAKQSALAVGVAANNEYVVIHYRNLPQERPLFVLQHYQQHSSDALRILGCNAARLVKGLPFK